MADQGHSDTEDVEKWLGVSPRKQPLVIRQPPLVRQGSSEKQPPLVRQGSPEKLPPL
ncbi:MAG: hypothetical protein Q9214_006896, partial [Letrouitia sp. 1 TL-2023]